MVSLKKISKSRIFKDKVEFDKKELEYYLQIWQHHDTMFWNRFSVFIAFLAITVAFLSVLFLIFLDPNSNIDKNIVLVGIGIISFGVLILGIFWHSMLARTQNYVEIYYNLVIRAQSQINFDILIPDDENKKIDFGMLAKYRTKNIVNLIFYCGHAIFLFLMLIVGFLLFT
jgi:hypothetical protein